MVAGGGAAVAERAPQVCGDARYDISLTSYPVYEKCSMAKE
jgi:hypothetical protein